MGMFDKCDDMYCCTDSDYLDAVGEALAEERNNAKVREPGMNYGASPAKEGVVKIKTVKSILQTGEPGCGLSSGENVLIFAEDFCSLWNAATPKIRNKIREKYNNIPEFKPFQYYWDVAARVERDHIKDTRSKGLFAKTLMTYDGWKHFGQQVMQGQKSCCKTDSGDCFFSFEQTIPVVTSVSLLNVIAAIIAEHKPLVRDGMEQYPEWVRQVYFGTVATKYRLKRDAY